MHTADKITAFCLTIFILLFSFAVPCSVYHFAALSICSVNNSSWLRLLCNKHHLAKVSSSRFSGSLILFKIIEALSGFVSHAHLL